MANPITGTEYFADDVSVTCSVTGTANYTTFTLSPAAAPITTFPDGAVIICFIAAVDPLGNLTGTAWELARLTVGTSGTVLTRTDANVINGSAGVNTRVTWGASTTVQIQVVSPALMINNTRSLADGKLTLTSGSPFTTADVIGASTIYYMRYRSDLSAVPSSFNDQWLPAILDTDKSITLSGLTSGKLYDIFEYNTGSGTTLELSAAWTNDTTRADALTFLNGVLVKSGATSRKYLGTFRATSAMTTEDSMANRFLFDYYWPDLWKVSVNANRVFFAGYLASCGPAVATGLVPTGTILDFAASSVPSGYLACDGSAVSRSTYATLFGVISTTWGAGDGSTTFNVPDLRGRTAIGSGTGSGLSARTLAATGGEETHVLTTTEMPSHTHPPGGTALGFQNRAAGSTVLSTVGGGFSTYPTASVTGSAGSDGAHNNMQPFAVTTKIIKT